MTIAVKSSDDFKLSATSEAFEPTVYADTAAKASLVQVHLTESVYEADVPKIMINQNEEGSLNSSFEGEPGRCDFDQVSGWCLGEYIWKVDIRIGRKKALKLKCKYVVVYDGLDGCDADYVRLYFEKVGRFTTFPYFRSHFATNTANSGLALPPLPSLTERVD